MAPDVSDAHVCRREYLLHSSYIHWYTVCHHRNTELTAHYLQHGVTVSLALSSFTVRPIGVLAAGACRDILYTINHSISRPRGRTINVHWLTAHCGSE